MSLLDSIFRLTVFLNGVKIVDVPQPLEIVSAGANVSSSGGRTVIDLSALDAPQVNLVACRFATTVDDSLSGLAARDGVTPVAGDRALVNTQTNAEENGIYVTSAGAWSRATDYDELSEINVGDTVRVVEGAVNSHSTWKLTTKPAILGTNTLTFTKLDNISLATEPDQESTTQTTGATQSIMANIAIADNTLVRVGVVMWARDDAHNTYYADATHRVSRVNAGAPYEYGGSGVFVVEDDNGIGLDLGASPKEGLRFEISSNNLIVYWKGHAATNIRADAQIWIETEPLLGYGT